MKQVRNDKIAFKHYIKEAAKFIRRYNRPYKKSIAFDRKDALVIAHRGLSGLEKENTLTAFALAGGKGYYGIETDVHKTADGKYVIIHDDTTGRVAEFDFVVEQTDFDTLRNLRLKDKNGRVTNNLRIPTLAEYIETCKQYDKIAVLELKNHFEEADISEIAKIIEGLGYLDKTVFISFDLPNLISVKKLYPNQSAQYLTCIYEQDLIEKLKKYRLDLDIYYRELNKSRIDLLHQNGIKVNCWTVDSKRAAERLAAWGVDFITTNILE
ncbi:MAG: glycerophosphodiester phosphodiesterase family protein [Clostridia bacterium]|nr:glycerophosphodiester phosphodiesterase family protein [Clostridia bacterium]